MKIPFTNIIIGKAPVIVNLDKKQPTRTKIIKQITERQLIRTRKDIQDWVEAVNLAESKLMPTRTRLQEIYKGVIIDGHVIGIMGAIADKIKAKKFMIVDSNGDKDDEKSKLLEKEWFFKFLDFIVEALFFGYSLVQLGDIIDDGFPNIELVPREHVIPEWEIVKKSLFVNNRKDGFRYLERPFKDWFIFIGEKKNLGLLNIAAPHAIAKKSVFASAWEYTEIFGIPIRLGKTDINDPERRKNMEIMLESMGSASFGVFDHDDDIELKEGSKQSGTMEVFSIPIKMANEEISKGFARQTGLFDEKSFVGSVEAQERLFNEMILAIMRNARFIINNQLISRMVIHRILPEGFSFKWADEETLSVKDKAEIIKNLSPFYTFTPEVVAEQIGIPVENAVLSPEVKASSVMKDVKAYYADFMNTSNE